MIQLKKILITCFAFFSGLLMYGQAHNASVMIDNVNRDAVMISIDQPLNITSEAFQQRLARSGLKYSPKNGEFRFKGVTLSEISPEKVDIYAKITKGSQNGSIVYMSVTLGYNDYVHNGKDGAINQNIKNFLESFMKDTNNQPAKVMIGYQVSDVAKDEKSLQMLLDEQRNLEKQRSVIDSRLLDIQNQINVIGDGINKRKSGVEGSRVKPSTSQ
jgi:hypothetical protein